MNWEESKAFLLRCLPEASNHLAPWVQEIRVRAGQPMVFTGSGRRETAQWQPAQAQVAQAVEALTGHSLHARQKEAAQGAVALPGGHRLGLCGQMGPEGFRYLSGFCLRIAGQWPGVADELVQRIDQIPLSLLIIGPPGAGKTTFLRDLCRQWSMAGVQAAIHDERGELAALHEGVPQLDIGPMTDVVAGCAKGKGLVQILRSLSPQVIFTDELDGRTEASALGEAALGGVKVCASAHGKSLFEAQKRLGLAEPFFDGYVVLAQGHIKALYDREGKEWV